MVVGTLAQPAEVTTVMTIAAALLGILGTALVLRHRSMPLAERIDAVLPQSQCEQCGYPGCRPYAQAIAEGKAAINRCPPGGARVIRKLARLSRRPYLELDASCGAHKARQLAVIDEARCIGCTLCIQACPVDAIIGAPKLMHTVLRNECTGCELCLPPCPVDCIELVPAPWSPWARLSGKQSLAASRARRRFVARRERRERDALAVRRRGDPRSSESPAEHVHIPGGHARQRKRAVIEAALERARLRLAQGVTRDPG